MEPSRVICTFLIARVVVSMALVLSQLDIGIRKRFILYNLDLIMFGEVVDIAIGN